MSRQAPLPIEPRECVPCRVWTECGSCPDCGARLGDPPYAAAPRAGELDFAVLPRVLADGACAACGLAAPFHRSADCPGITFRAPVPAPQEATP